MPSKKKPPKKKPLPPGSPKKAQLPPKKEFGNVVLTPIPYGQRPALSRDDRLRVRKYYFDLAQNMTKSTPKTETGWPEWLMTFEVWCRLTCYEPGQARGGTKFQKMMTLILGAPFKTTTSHGHAYHTTDKRESKTGERPTIHEDWDAGDIFTWDAETQTYGKMFLQPEGEMGEEWYQGFIDGGTKGIARHPQGKGLDDSRPAPAHIPATARPTYDYVHFDKTEVKKRMLIGIPTALVTNNRRGIYNENQSEIHPNPAVVIYSKFDWEMKANIQAKNEESVGGAHNNWMGNGTDHDKRHCWEVTAPFIATYHDKYWYPCPNLANRAAMIFGLYYYAGCEEADYQWEMREKVGKDVFHSRCRCPNPHYGERNKEGDGKIIEWYKADFTPKKGAKAGAIDMEHGYMYIYEDNNTANAKHMQEYFDTYVYPEDEDDPEPKRPPFTTMGGVFQHDYDNNKIKDGVEHRFFLPKTSHFNKDETHKYMSHWYFLQYPFKETFRSLIIPYYYNEAHEMVKGVATAERHGERGVAMRDEGLDIAAGPDKDNFDFGFSIPQAFLLWPHTKVYEGGKVKSEVTFHETVTDKDEALKTMRRASFISPPVAKTDFPLRFGPDREGEKTEKEKGYAQHFLAGYDQFKDLTPEGQRLFLLREYKFHAKGKEVAEEDAEPTDGEGDEPTDEQEAEEDAEPVDGEDSVEDSDDEDYVDPAVTVPAAAKGGRGAKGRGGRGRGRGGGGVLNDVELNATPTANLLGEEVETSGANGDEMPEGVTTATVEDGSDQNMDGASVSSAKVLKADMKRDVQIYFGYDGFELSNALRECDTNNNFSEAEIRAYAALKNPANSTVKKNKEIDQAMIKCNFKMVPLTEGAESLGDNYEKGFHWKTDLHAPWNYTQLYSLPNIDVKQVDNEPPAVTIQWGEASDRFKCTLSGGTPEDKELFTLNLAKICIIFIDKRGVGPRKSTLEAKNVTEEHKIKVNGMLKGLFCDGDSAQNYQYPRPIPNRKEEYIRKQLWGPVFTTDPTKLLKQNGVTECLKEYIQATENEPVNNFDALKTCLEELAAKTNKHWMELFEGVESAMTVAEWVTTPWHLEHLPYTQQHAVFKDNEGYSEGCKRCCRRFYEYPYLMYPDGVGTTKGYSAWGNDTWRLKSDPKSNDPCRMSPVPIHDPRFWSDTGKWDGAKPARVQHVNKDLQEVEKPGGPVETEETAYLSRGFWQHYKLQLDRLNHEDLKSRKLLDTHNRPKKDFFAYFRRYMNMAYQNDVADDPKSYGNNLNGFYKGQAQGYMFIGARRKMRYGDKDMRLARSHKYGNTCRDCALVLEKVGLFVKNNRHVSEQPIVFGDKEAVVEGTSWWEWMGTKSTQPGGGGNVELNILDGLTVFQGVNKYKAMRDELKNAGVSEEGISARFDKLEKESAIHAKTLGDLIMKKNSRALPGQLSRIAKPPMLHMQKSVMRPTRDIGLVKEALATLERFIIDGDCTDANTKNPALRDMLFDLLAAHRWNQDHQVVDASHQFDSNLFRVEYRNCKVQQRKDGSLRWLKGSKWVELPTGLGHGRVYGKLTAKNMESNTNNEETMWYNCLIVDQFTGMEKAKEDSSGKFSNKAQFIVEVYMATRTGPGGMVGARYTTQWRGDRWLTEKGIHQNDAWVQTSEIGNRVVKQIRGYRQSRLFITYSLHRPVGGEEEGRNILEKMRLACLKIFGDDKYLSQMLVFGKMLSVETRSADRVSRGQWKVIDHTKKADAMDTFYGADGKSSYLSDTFETHIEKVEVDGGIEIGPKMHHPHFHIMLTLNHYSYVQFDYFKMNRFLELMFKGIKSPVDTGLNDVDNKGRPMYKLLDAIGLPFYGDNENPYVDIKLYAQDDWRAVLHNYVRKNTIPGMLEAVTAGYMPNEENTRATTTSNT